MKKNIILFICFITFLNTYSQQKSVQVNTQVSAISYELAKTTLQTWLNNHNYHIMSQNDNDHQVSLVLHLSEAQYNEWKSWVPSLGNVDYQSIETVDNADAIDEVTLELNFLQNRKKEYLDLMDKLGTQSENYQALWREKMIVEERIFNLEKRQLTLKENAEPFQVKFTLSEEMTSPQEGKVSFVNMPGIEYSYLRVSSPNHLISASAYQGYFLKYLFTKGKSYASVGAYKANTPMADSVLTELFAFNFGQDFYSRHLGRGNKKFGNLYSGYTIGYMIGTNDTRKVDIGYIAPSVGLELFKNKYLLWDLKANYMIPFTYNRDLRGVAINTSLNFVF
jgi:hypothetical protein